MIAKLGIIYGSQQFALFATRTWLMFRKNDTVISSTTPPSPTPLPYIPIHVPGSKSKFMIVLYYAKRGFLFYRFYFLLFKILVLIRKQSNLFWCFWDECLSLGE